MRVTHGVGLTIYIYLQNNTPSIKLQSMIDGYIYEVLIYVMIQNNMLKHTRCHPSSVILTFLDSR